MSQSFLCPNCGLRVPVPDDHARPKIRCGECGVVAEIPPSLRRAVPPKPPRGRHEGKKADDRPAPPQPRTPRPPSDVLPWAVPVGTPPNYAAVYIWGTSDDEEDSNPYPVADPERPRCPHCEAELEYDAVLCLRCGFDQREGRKRVQEYQPRARRWDAGMSAPRRMILFVLGQAGSVAFGLTGAWLMGDLVAFFAPWLLFSALTAFLLGTYDRVVLTRDRRGRVELTRTWHVCFWRFPPTRVGLRGYDGVSTGKHHEAGFFEWMVFVSLLPGLFPALIWWWVAIRQDTVYVALTRDNGYAAEILYRGWNEAQALEMAATLRDAARLTYRVG